MVPSYHSSTFRLDVDLVYGRGPPVQRGTCLSNNFFGQEQIWFYNKHLDCSERVSDRHSVNGGLLPAPYDARAAPASTGCAIACPARIVAGAYLAGVTARVRGWRAPSAWPLTLPIWQALTSMNMGVTFICAKGASCIQEGVWAMKRAAVMYLRVSTIDQTT